AKQRWRRPLQHTVEVRCPQASAGSQAPSHPWKITEHAPRVPADPNRLESARREEPAQRAAVEETDVWIGPRPLDRQTVSERVPPAEEREVQPPSPVGDVGRGDDQRPSRTQDTQDLLDASVGQEDVLDHLEAKDDVEGVVCERKVVRPLDQPSVKSPTSSRRNSSLRDVDADIGA